MTRQDIARANELLREIAVLEVAVERLQAARSNAEFTIKIEGGGRDIGANVVNVLASDLAPALDAKLERYRASARELGVTL